MALDIDHKVDCPFILSNTGDEIFKQTTEEESVVTYGTRSKLAIKMRLMLSTWS